MEEACAYEVAKFIVVLTFVFIIWSVGVWDEWGVSENAHIVIG
jgi:hypothetical protein